MLYFYRPTIDWGRRLELGANTYRVLVHPTPLLASWPRLALRPPMGSEGMANKKSQRAGGTGKD